MAETDWKYLQYNVETGQKRTGDGSSGGSSSLSDLDDTNISSPSDGQMLGYDETEGKWKNVAAPGGNVDDVEVNGVSVVNAQKVAEIKSYKEVTQAQYEALPDTKLSDGILYAIKDGGQAVDGFPPLIYSDEEREVGVWRDGKPLYQKTVVFTGTFYGSTTVGNINTPNIDSYAEIKATILDITNAWKTIAFSHPTASYSHSFFINPSGDLNLRSQLISSNALSKIQLTIQYTKTTDTPGSGTWTTQGTLAHHYSTDEHIVGTWIDGKPLYEKTFQFSNYVSIPTKSWTTVMDVSSLSISKLIRCDFIDMEGIYWSGALNRISNGNLQSYIFEGWPVKELTLQYTKTTD